MGAPPRSRTTSRTRPDRGEPGPASREPGGRPSRRDPGASGHADGSRPDGRQRTATRERRRHPRDERTGEHGQDAMEGEASTVETPEGPEVRTNFPTWSRSGIGMADPATDGKEGKGAVGGVGGCGLAAGPPPRPREKQSAHDTPEGRPAANSQASDSYAGTRPQSTRHPARRPQRTTARADRDCTQRRTGRRTGPQSPPGRQPTRPNRDRSSPIRPTSVESAGHRTESTADARPVDTRPGFEVLPRRQAGLPPSTEAEQPEHARWHRWSLMARHPLMSHPPGCRRAACTDSFNY